MIPLRDTIPASRRPLVVIAIVVVNALVFLLELSAGAHLERIFYTYGLVPAHALDTLSNAPYAIGGWLVPLFTSMFLHGGFLHVIGNLWFLWVFGDNVEDRLGHRRFLVFYLACGLVAALTQVLTAPGSTVPIIGASGAIAGVLGAYMVLYPRARVITFIPIFFFPYLIRVPAVFFLGIWFLEQVWSGGITLGAGQSGGVAWWAHTGGFLVGAAYAWRWRRPSVVEVDVLDDVPWRRRGRW